MKVKHGYMPCETCGSRVIVKKNEKGTLSYGCDECDASPYAREGTTQHALWSKKLELTTPAQEAAPEKPATEPEPKTEKPKSGDAGFFSNVVG